RRFEKRRQNYGGDQRSRGRRSSGGLGLRGRHALDRLAQSCSRGEPSAIPHTNARRVRLYGESSDRGLARGAGQNRNYRSSGEGGGPGTRQGGESRANRPIVSEATHGRDHHRFRVHKRE